MYALRLVLVMQSVPFEFVSGLAAEFGPRICNRGSLP